MEEMDQESLPPEKNTLLNESIDEDQSNVVKSSKNTNANKEIGIKVPKNRIQSNEIAMVSNIMNDNSHDDSDNTGEFDSEEEPYEMTSIDEKDTKRFIFIRENASAKSKTATESMAIGNKKVYLPDNSQITLMLSDVIELYDQDINSVATEMKERKSIENGEDWLTQSDYGKSLYTSTWSTSTKALTPKSNTKLESTMV